jgi:hypothetical protein
MQISRERWQAFREQAPTEADGAILLKLVQEIDIVLAAKNLIGSARRKVSNRRLPQLATLRSAPRTSKLTHLDTPKILADNSVGPVENP